MVEFKNLGQVITTTTIKTDAGLRRIVTMLEGISLYEVTFQQVPIQLSLFDEVGKNEQTEWKEINRVCKARYLDDPWRRLMGGEEY